MKLIIQIPCYNEERTLAEVIRDLPSELPGINQIEYLVIDDGSTDRTVEVAHQMKVNHVLCLGSHQGLSSAFLAGIRKSLELGADIIVNTDGDNQYQANDIEDLIAPIVFNKLDIVVGARPIDSIQHFSFFKKKLQSLGSYVVRHFSGTDIPDTTSGFRAYSAEAAMKLHVFNTFTYTLETIIQAGHVNIRIGAVPIHVNPKTRESHLIQSMPRYIWRSSLIILRSYITYKPLKTFFLMSLLPGSLGVTLGIRWFILGGKGHVPSLVFSSVLLTVAFLLIVMGVLADLISANRKLIQEVLFGTRVQIYKRANPAGEKKKHQ